MYRDDPLDDEADLEAVVGEEAVAELRRRGGPEAVAAAVDLLRLAQGWVDDAEVGGWLRSEQRRLDGRSPLGAVAAGEADLAADALRAWLAARG